MDNSTGKIGEEYITKQLQKMDYSVLARNFHSKFGEIDIIAQNSKYIVFVEVKTRMVGGIVSPFEAVTKSKQRKLSMTAQYYLMYHSSPLQPRFDVAAVFTENGIVTSFQYLENAF